MQFTSSLPQAQHKAICCSPGKELHGSNPGLHTGACWGSTDQCGGSNNCLAFCVYFKDVQRKLCLVLTDVLSCFTAILTESLSGKALVVITVTGSVD